MFSTVHFSSKTVEHSTPQLLFDLLNSEFNFRLDACANADNAKTQLYFDQDQDALSIDWMQYCLDRDCKPIIYCNPPYRKPEQPCAGRKQCDKKACRERGHHLEKYLPGTGDFVEKGYKESLNGCTCVFLLPGRFDTKWFHEFILLPQVIDQNIISVEIRAIRGRLTFGNALSGAPFPSVIVIWKPKFLYYSLD